MSKLFDKTNNRFLTIDRIKKHKEAISKGLKIEWETDPEKMQFDKLRSYSGIKGVVNSEILRVENHKIRSSDTNSLDIFCGSGSDLQSYMETIDILMSGGKLIPPIATEGYAIVDGVEKMVRSWESIQDGYHRMTLAKYFGIDTIPVVVFKAHEGYWFTLEKWSFDGPRIREETKTESGFSWTEYNGLRATSKKDGKVFTFKDYGAYIDDSNTEYLVLNAIHL